MPPTTRFGAGLTVAQHIFRNPEDCVCLLDLGVDATHSCREQSSHTPCCPHVGAASLLRTQCAAWFMAVARHHHPGQQAELVTLGPESHQNPETLRQGKWTKVT
jgi:hypothetical protein